MNEVYGNVLDSHSFHYASNGEHGKTYHVDRYLQDRDAFRWGALFDSVDLHHFEVV